MSLKEKIEEDFKQSLKQGQAERLITLRALRSALHNREIELRPRKQKLTDEMVIELIQREAKKRRESIEMFTQGQRPD
ncbi:GatB/YqeY domain-containing protein, partial [Patescibacteria group bacterium]|nr:GatB/YqeY domain-containing protein [Patescibacteria group bacterium]